MSSISSRARGCPWRQDPGPPELLDPLEEPDVPDLIPALWLGHHERRLCFELDGNLVVHAAKLGVVDHRQELARGGQPRQELDSRITLPDSPRMSDYPSWPI